MSDKDVPAEAQAFSVTTISDREGSMYVTVLPGVLAKSHWQYRQLRRLLKPLGTVDGIDYVGPYFEHNKIIEGVAKDVSEKVKSGQRVLLVGSSMGAVMIVFVLQALQRLRVDSRMVSAVLIDPPSGAESLKAVPNGAAGIVAHLGRLPQWLVNHGPLNAAFQKMFCSGISADAPIEVPWDCQRGANAYRQGVRLRCFVGQQGFDPTLFFGQLAWMVRVGRNGSLAEACDAIDGKFSITHIACTGDNEVVENPLAQCFYLEYLASARFIKNPTNHTDYEQSAPSWLKFLEMERVFAF